MSEVEIKSEDADVPQFVVMMSDSYGEPEAVLCNGMQVQGGILILTGVRGISGLHAHQKSHDLAFDGPPEPADRGQIAVTALARSAVTALRDSRVWSLSARAARRWRDLAEAAEAVALEKGAESKDEWLAAMNEAVKLAEGWAQWSSERKRMKKDLADLGRRVQDAEQLVKAARKEAGEARKEAEEWASDRHHETVRRYEERERERQGRIEALARDIDVTRARRDELTSQVHKFRQLLRSVDQLLDPATDVSVVEHDIRELVRLRNAAQDVVPIPKSRRSSRDRSLDEEVLARALATPGAGVFIKEDQ